MCVFVTGMCVCVCVFSSRLEGRIAHRLFGKSTCVRSDFFRFILAAEGFFLIYSFVGVLAVPRFSIIAS